MDVLYEDNHLIIVNKAVGDLVQGDATNDVTLLDDIKNYLKVKYNKPGNVFLGLVHRLDRPTSGAIIYAKTTKALSRLNESFKERETVKKYWAVVDNMPRCQEETLEHYLVRNTTSNKSVAMNSPRRGAKKSSLTYKVIGKSDKYTLLEIDLHTGRHHQIRAQLAAINVRIKGDLKYGFPRSNKDGGIHLHAREISFMHPVKKERVTVVAPCPKNDPLWKYFDPLLQD